MKEKTSQVHEWYTKSPQEFRKDLLEWYLGIPRVVIGIVVVLLITSIGVRLKKVSDTSILETIFDNLESIALGSAGVIFLLEIKDRQKRNQYEAWQVINSAQGQTGSGGRIQALEDLNRDGVDLQGLMASRADLTRVNLCGASLQRANFRKTYLFMANLKETDLSWAYMKGVNLSLAKLQRASLFDANLEEADLSLAKLQGTDLRKTNLKGANLMGANLEKANLRKANLEDAFLFKSSLQGSDLREANLEGTVLYEVNLEGAMSITQEQLFRAKICHVTLPGNIQLEPNRDCILMLTHPMIKKLTDI